VNSTMARQLLIDQMEEAGFIQHDRGTWVCQWDGRTYLVGLALFDVTEGS